MEDEGSDDHAQSLHRQSQQSHPLPRLSLPPPPTPTPTSQRPPSAVPATHPHYIQQSLASQVGYSSYPPPNPFVPLAPGPGPKVPRTSAAAAAQNQNLKRKRSSELHIARHASEDASGSDHSYPHAQITPSPSAKHLQAAAAAAAADLKKRTKTQRACDKCRTKKIRCFLSPPPVVLPSISTHPSPSHSLCSFLLFRHILDATSCPTKTPRDVHTANSTTTNALSSSPSLKPASRSARPRRKPTPPSLLPIAAARVNPRQAPTSVLMVPTARSVYTVCLLHWR